MKSLKLSVRILICIAVAGSVLYSYIEKQNEITSLRMAIPSETKELKVIQEQIVRLQYEIDSFENPTHLMKLAQTPEFAHLKHPLTKDIILLPASATLDQRK